MSFKSLSSYIGILLIFSLSSCHLSTKKDDISKTQAPRIINIINFIRQTDYRIENSDSLLYQTVEEQLNLINRYNLPATFLLQYDALIKPEYQQLLKSQLNQQSEIGGWFEITQPQVEDAGLEWRGEHSWVSHANIAFSTGYTKDEREKLVDVYMEKFKEIFGEYPKSMGSWYIDAHTLNYMYEKYGIIASCNCKDQIGTDGYTLWGGYWNQAYYPSKLNGYMPAQSQEQQIPVPVFRMLGSDPIYQYDDGLGNDRQGVISLEPVYTQAGKNRAWVHYFFNAIVDQPCLAFNYAQAGQENSFTWDAMKDGLEMQIPIIDSLQRTQKVQVLTLAETGKWFKEKFSITPATAVTVLNDIRNENNKTVWFNSRYYRANLLWKNQDFSFRDIHLFDERFKSQYVDKPGESSQFFFYTLPMVDGYMWSTPEDRAGMQIVQHSASGEKKVVRLNPPTITEPDTKTLVVTCTDVENHSFKMTFTESDFEITCDTNDKDFRWSLDLHTASSELPFKEIEGQNIMADFQGFKYVIRCLDGKPEISGDCALRISPVQNRIKIDCTNNR
ncbi:hypothetical protein NEE14_011585 [Parabacteroides sp. AD58]|uniref:Uncharacterized protein n=1 Tax=Parabacteroides absconsus TaxID=2951805 RepID=A0ABZ2IN85_9BACT|nr:hypothetical protein [Parabacteroides sp. AD58]MCM6901127.1 hypothetical protein [Parabacteroides sp. AD58]